MFIFDEKDFKSLITEEIDRCKKVFDVLAVQPIYYDPSEVIDPLNDSRLKVKEIFVSRRHQKVTEGMNVTRKHNQAANTTMCTVANRDGMLVYEKIMHVRGFVQLGILQIERVWYTEVLSNDSNNLLDTVFS